MTKTMIGAALALALGTGAASAHDEGKSEAKQVKKIVIMHKDGTTKDIDVERLHALGKDCGDAKLFENSDSTEVDGKTKRTKIIFCGQGEGDRLAALEKARARLAEGDDFGVDPRAKALAALDAEIARLKAE